MKTFQFLSTAFLGLCFAVSLAAQQQGPPPEVREFGTVVRIQEPTERLKELQRMKVAYPESELTGMIDFAINIATLESESRKANDFKSLVAVQTRIISAVSHEPEFLQIRFGLLETAARELVGHPKVADFPKAELLKDVLECKTEGMKILADPEFANKNNMIALGLAKTMFELPLAKAQMLNGDGKTALETLKEYGKSGNLNAQYYNLLAEVYLSQKLDREAMEAYIRASIERDGEALEKAKAIYTKLNKNEKGFEAQLEHQQAQLPFHPEPFIPPANWSGKAVLAELFTGSECPPCVGADFGFDGLIDSVSTKHLAILEYHLPIPRYDPMMNPATQKRQDYYGIRSTPSVVIDGTTLQPGGGGRAQAKMLYENYLQEIAPRLEPAPIVTINAKATLADGKVKVDCKFSRVIEGSEYYVTLVQTEEKYKGSNGIFFHKMVVRDIETVKPADSASVTFNIAETEKSADTYITEWGKTAPANRTNGSQWPLKHNKIDITKLSAVIFVQDTNTKQVHNAFVVNVQ